MVDSDRKLRALQRKVEKWDKQLPSPHTRTFDGSTGVVKGQHYSYKRVLNMIQALLQDDHEQRNYLGKMREMSAVQG